MKNFKVNYNQVYDNNNIGIDFIGYEGTASGENDRARQGECKYNYVYNITSANNPGYEGSRSADGIYVDGGSDILIYGNIVSNCDIGIEAASEHKNKSTNKISIINNLVMNCSSYAGICFGGSDSSINGTAKEIIVKNNTLYNNNCGVVIQNANSSTNVIKKNVIYQSNKGNAIYGKIATNIFKDNIIYQANGSISSTVKNSNTIATSSLVSGSGTNIKVSPAYSNYGYVASSEATPENSTIKVDYDSNFVYIYAKTTSNYPSYQLLINSDNNSSTGYLISSNATSGYDYLIENNSLYQSNANTSSWSNQWKKYSLLNISAVKNQNVYEFKLPRKDLDIKNSFGFIFRLLDAKYTVQEKSVEVKSTLK